MACSSWFNVSVDFYIFAAAKHRMNLSFSPVCGWLFRVIAYYVIQDLACFLFR